MLKELHVCHFGSRFDMKSYLWLLTSPWCRYWVRTEDQVRKELFNKHQLRLLQICLNYLKVLYNRADKIHQGISLEDQGDLAKYQLPNDLVDCFEATALFIMQSAMSLKTTKNEMNSWQHVPGIAFEELQTPAIEAALERLGELGQSAQTSMTRAEKILALSDPETSMMSMGVAGPELLVAVILHNLQKRPLLQDVDMDVNQLYQEYTSKLVSFLSACIGLPFSQKLTTAQQYQINQFPRKRQLRDIHALQEELSVVQSVNSWQQQSFEKFRRILNPKSFSNPIPQLRIAMFPSEAECLGAGLKSLQSQATELDALEKRTHYLRSQLKQSVEILEADHGKAILVFTMITTIFLPLYVSQVD
jgi:Mg2+ and Co2+ transporter CorA